MALNLKTIDLNLLVIFEAVYSTGNISHASERLNMSQPAVSNALTRLRQHVDDPLFIRATRGVAPTSKAHEMIVPIRTALGLVESQFEGDEIDLATYQRLFRVTMVDNVEPFMMPPVIHLITEKAPGISIEMLQATPSFAEDVRTGKLDLACFAYPPDATDLVIEPIAPVDAVVVSRRGHPAIKGKLDLHTFGSLPGIALNRKLRGLNHMDKDLAAAGIKRRIVYMVSKIWAIAPMVERTELIGILPRRFAEELKNNFAIETYEMPVPVSEQHAYLMWHVSNERNPGHRWLREAMLTAMRENY